MENPVINDANIREYLLGRLDPKSDLVERIDEQIFTEPEFPLNVDVIEDEIIEAYLEESLSSEDMRAVESHFLRPPERQSKLKTARLFSHYCRSKSVVVKTDQPTPARHLFKAFGFGRVLPSFRTCAEIAASLVFVISTLTLLNQRRETDMAMKQVSQQLAQERQSSVASSQHLQSVLPSLQPALAMLNLVTPGLQRGGGVLPEVKVNSGTRALHVEVALSSRSRGTYQVQLRHTGQSVWSRNGVEATAVPGGATLKLEIPAEVLPQGTYELAVIPSGEGTISYWFSVSRVQ